MRTTRPTDLNASQLAAVRSAEMDERHPFEADPITRRRSLATLGGLAAAALGVGGLAKVAESDAAGEGPAGVASGAVKCVLTPEQTEGPYYIDGEKIRRNITEGKAGTPLTLRLKVVNASSCKPIKGALVDIWHADAVGVYSGFGAGASSRTFMRGLQRTNAQGLAIFRTVYPGWYAGRTVHIHVKVHVGGNVVHTGQLYFPDAVTDAAYRKAPYTSRPGRTTRNSSDSIFLNGGGKSLLSLRKVTSGYVGSITMGVVRR
jgi:protocatechuate 3,4-dioxygenase beta subunit